MVRLDRYIGRPSSTGGLLQYGDAVGEDECPITHSPCCRHDYCRLKNSSASTAQKYKDSRRKPHLNSYPITFSAHNDTVTVASPPGQDRATKC